MTIAALPNEIAPILRSAGVRYSSVWEDSRMLLGALRLRGDDDVLSIASAGCNALALLLQEPRSVTAVDLNPAQTALLDLKIAGIRVLDHESFAGLIGARPHVSRIDLYERLRTLMPDVSRQFWDSHTDDLATGVMHVGRLDRYFREFEPLRVDGETTNALADGLLACTNVAQQRRYFDEQLDRPAFRDAFEEYFGRASMSRSGRDSAQFRWVPDEFNVGAYFWRRFRDVCTRLPVRGNHYLELFLTGRYRSLERAPAYLHPAAFARLKTLIGRLTTVTSTVEEVVEGEAQSRFSALNLSDMFEYLSLEATGALFDRLAERVRGGGRICYWNLLVSRAAPSALRRHIIADRALARRLWLCDRAWFYSDFHVEQVAKP